VAECEKMNYSDDFFTEKTISRKALMHIN